MSKRLTSSRREFMVRTAGGAVLLGASAALGGQPESREAMHPIIKAGVRRARKLAVDTHDRIYLAADRAIFIYDSDGNALSQINLQRPARAVTVAGDGRLYVGLINQIAVYNADGQLTTRWRQFGDHAVIAGIAAADDDVLVADAGNKLVWRLDKNGRVVNRIRHDGGFHAPAEFFPVVFGGNGRFHVGHSGRHRVETYTLAGERVSAWGERSRELTGFSGCCNPVSVAACGDGAFITAERGIPRVKLYDAEGRFVRLLAGPDMFAANERASRSDQSAGCLWGGLDVAIDSRQRVLILDRESAEIHAIKV